MAAPWRCRLRLHRWQRLRNPKAAGTANAVAAEPSETAMVEVSAASEVTTPPVRHSSGRLVRCCPPGIGWPGGLSCPWTRGTVDTVACRKATRGKRESQ